MRLTVLLVLAGASVSSVPAVAQSMTAYQSGLKVATGRGYVNADCYARVFVKHAVVVENANYRRSWFAASTPAYNAEQRSRCGIDRLADIASRRNERSPVRSTYPRRSAYATGLQIAGERGHTGGQATCYARVFQTFASVNQSFNGLVHYAVDGRSVPTFALELHRSCGLSR